MTSHNENLFTERPLPDRIDLEQLILGASLTDAEAFPQIAELLSSEDFSLKKHRRIFASAGEVYARGESINIISVGNELLCRDQLQSIDGPSYLASIADYLPRLLDLASYCEKLRTVSAKRKAITAMAALMDRCYDPGEDAGNFLGDIERITEILNSSDRAKSVARTSEQVVTDAGGINLFLSPEKNPGIAIPFADINTTLSGLRRSKFILLGARPAVGKSAIATQIAEHAAALGKNVMFVTLEMSAEDVLKRSIAGRASVSSYRFREGHVLRLPFLSAMTHAR